MLQQAILTHTDAARRTIAERGQALEHSGHFQTALHQVSFHTCIGTTQSGKTVNQDAVLAVVCDDRSPIKWACAIADGVSSSLLSEAGSRIATWVSLAALLQSQKWTSSQSRALAAIRSAQSAIADFGAVLQQDLVELKFKPSYLPAPAYRYVVSRQTYCQTTLCLVWCDGKSIFIANVGDAGALQSAPGKPCIKLFFPNLRVSQVNAISPLTPKVELDHWSKVAAPKANLAVFTDGVAKGLTERTGDELPADFNLEHRVLVRQAKECLEDLVAATSEEAADNMTLLAVSPS